MNRLSLARRTQIIGALVEGNSIRSVERMTDTHRDTVMRLLVQVGEGSAKIMDDEMRHLLCERVQVDEIWAYVGKKQRQLTPADDRARTYPGTLSERSSTLLTKYLNLLFGMEREVG